MKKIQIRSFLFGIAVAALLFSLIHPVWAEQQPVSYNGINLRINGRDAVNEGESLTLSNGAVVPYSIGYNGTNYLPLGRLAELIGISAAWDGSTRTAIIENDPNDFGVLSLTIGDWSVYRDAAYTRFNMVHFKDGKADMVYSMPGSRPAAMPQIFQTVTEYKDDNDGGKVYAVLFAAPGVRAAFPFSEPLIFELTNAFRGLHGVAPLTWNDTLAGAARAHSKDMHDNGYVEHVSPRGEKTSDRAAAVEYRFRALGENIAAGYDDSVRIVHALINSSGHRKNILNSAFSEMGAGNFTGEDGYRNYATQLYGTPF